MSFVGRRPLLLFGHSGICISYIIMGFFTYYSVNIGVLVMMCVFLLIYQNTSGPVAWNYAGETCCDVALGVSMTVLWGTVFVLNLITQPLMHSALQPYGVFWLFSVCNACAFFFMYFFVAETKGLPDAEKKR